MAVFIDDVKRANSSTIGGNLTEINGDTEIKNNTFTHADANVGVEDAFTRYGTNLNSANHWCEIGVPIWSPDNYACVAMLTRLASASTQGYGFGRRHDLSDDILSIFRWDSAVSAVDLVSVINAYTGSSERLRGESIGNVHRLLLNGTDMIRFADTTYPTNLRHGTWLYRQTTGFQVGGAPLIAGVFDNVSVFTNRATLGSATDATSYASASITPAAQSLVICCIVHTHASAIPKQADSVTGASISGATFIGKVQFNTVATARSTLELWAAVGTGSAGAVTFTYSGGTSQTQTGATWSIVEVTNVNTAIGTNGIIQFVTNSGNSATTFSSGTIVTPFKSEYNPAFTVFGRDINSTITPPTSHLELGDAGHTTPTESIQTLYTMYSIPVGGIVQSTGTSSDYGGITVEIAGKVGADKIWKPRLLVAS